MVGRIRAARIRRVVIIAASAVGAGLVGATPAPGATLRWINAAGGLFGDAANWSPVDPPDALDDLIFDLVAAYMVTGDAEAGVVSVEAGEVFFNLSLSASNAFLRWDVGAGASQDASAQLTGRVSSFQGASVGTGAGSSGSMRISGADAAIEYGESVVIGRTGVIGSGSLLVEGGAQLSDSGAGLGLTTVHGSATVTGAGSLFRARTAEVTGRMSFGAGASSSVGIWNVAGELDVADAVVNAELAFGATSGSHVAITRAVIDASGASTDFQSATLTVNHDAQFRSFSLSFSNSVLEVGVSSSSIGQSQAMVSALLAEFTGSTLHLSLLDGFLPSLGDRVHLLSIDQTFSGVFADPFSAVDLLGVWNGRTPQLDLVPRGPAGGFDAFVTFVPAPGAGAALTIGLAAALTRRRRDHAAP